MWGYRVVVAPDELLCVALWLREHCGCEATASDGRSVVHGRAAGSSSERERCCRVLLSLDLPKRVYLLLPVRARRQSSSMGGASD
eukprot:4302175-Pyramimonas_sp.AAC.1